MPSWGSGNRLFCFSEIFGGLVAFVHSCSPRRPSYENTLLYLVG
jgi:hypothetical protein